MAKQNSNKPQASKSPKFVQVHYSELAGKTLAYAVAEILGTVDTHYAINDDGTITNTTGYAPQDNWEQVKELFAKYAPAFDIHRLGGKRSFYAVLVSDAVSRVVGAHGPTHAVALLRAVVVSGLEEEDSGQISVPEAFLASQVEALALEKGDTQGAFAFDTDPQGGNAGDALAKLQSEADVTPTLLQHAAKDATSTLKGGEGKDSAQQPQEQAQGAKPATAQDKPAAPAEAKPQAPAKPQDKPASGKPLPQGKHAQALAAHASQPAKGK